MENIIKSVKTPCYLIDEKKLTDNLKCLKDIIDRTECEILLAQKAFSMYSVYPLISQYLSGTTASGLYEARLGHEEMPERQVHVFSPAYTKKDMKELVNYADHIVFNSCTQWKKYRDVVNNADKKISCGLRVNPLYSEVETDIYNPCSDISRLGIKPDELEDGCFDGIEGLHFHALCEQSEDVLERVLEHFEDKLGKYFSNLKWINFGGGHHITRPDYDREALVECINRFKAKYGVQVYLEPGEAVALNAGYLISEVIEVQNSRSDIKNVILDTSAACHMPDVLEMPYRPNIVSSGKIGEKKYGYRLGGPTCLAGDIIGEYSFDKPLNEGDRLIFEDMAIYSMVKNNTFNGMPLPDINLLKCNGDVENIRTFGYSDFKMRL